MEKKTIGSFLAALRKANGLTQKQLAEKLNVSDKAVSRWERDECAPDLSLIPVLAEIYGVTTDEILRGQRRDPETPDREPDVRVTEKQMKRLLDSVQTKFRIRSIITLAIALVGIIAAAICNHGLNQAAIGFLVGSIFFVAAVLCQVIFLMLGFSAVSAEELDTDAVKKVKRSMAFATELTIGTVMVFLAGTCPLFTLTDGSPYFGLDAGYIFEEGLPYSILTILLCGVVSYIINIKAGYVKGPSLSAASRRLLLRYTGILMLVLIAIFVVQLCLNLFFLEKYHLYVPCQKFDTLEAFKAYMETPTDPEGNPMTLLYTDKLLSDGSNRIYYHYAAQDGTEYILSNGDISYLLPFYYDEEGFAIMNENPTPDEEAFTAENHYPYLRYNLSVAYVQISSETEIVPIYTFTHDQFMLGSDITIWVNLGFYLLDLCAIVATVVIFVKKKKA